MLPIIAYGPASGTAPGPDPGPAPDPGPSDGKLDYDDATVKGEKDIYTILIFPPVEPVRLVLSHGRRAHPRRQHKGRRRKLWGKKKIVLISIEKVNRAGRVAEVKP